ncbi:hypothetical protein FRC08_008322 [Ceratobasidium sp. 394]|nr:hypothetical protein FRC08_008322 [Ceratobasidium sp. 394]
MHAWQGIRRPFEWEAEGLSEDEEPRVAVSSRLPDMLPTLTHPNGWSDDQVEGMWDWIARGQGGLLPSEQVFQLIGNTGDHNEPLATDMAAGAKLYYGPRSRLYVARMLGAAPGDTQAKEEMISTIPRKPDDVQPYVPFSENSVRHMFEARCMGYHDLEQLVLDCNSYEQAFPVMSLFEVCRAFPPEPPKRHDDIAFLGGWWMPPTYFSIETAKGKDMQYPVFSALVRSGLLDHVPSQTLLAGPYALKWIIYQLIRYYYTIRMLEQGESPPSRSKWRPDTTATRNMIEQDIDFLSRRIEHSILRLIALRDEAESPLPIVQNPIGVVRQDRHVPIQASSRSPTPPTAPRPALKKAAAKKGKMKVEVVMSKGKSRSAAAHEMDRDPKSPSTIDTAGEGLPPSSPDGTYVPSEDVEETDTEMGTPTPGWETDEDDPRVLASPHHRRLLSPDSPAKVQRYRA